MTTLEIAAQIAHLEAIASRVVKDAKPENQLGAEHALGKVLQALAYCETGGAWKSPAAKLINRTGGIVVQVDSGAGLALAKLGQAAFGEVAAEAIQAMLQTRGVQPLSPRPGSPEFEILNQFRSGHYDEAMVLRWLMGE